MTDRDLASLAKAGDRAAVNELLRRATPALRWHVRLALRGAGASFDVFEDAFAAALEQAWKAVDRWDPEQGSLAAFVGPGVRSATRRLAGQMGHAVSIPSYHGAEKTRYVDRRRFGRNKARSMDAAPVGAPDDSAPLVERLPGSEESPESTHDAARILSRLSREDGRFLWAHACDEMNVEIAETMGCSREWAGTALRKALHRARLVACDPFRKAAA